MTKTFLVATVAALAITAPAQAERGGKDDGPKKTERAQAAEARGGGDQGAQRAQARAERQQQVRVERPQRAERQQVRVERPQRAERIRVERPQRAERIRVERSQRAERIRVERPQRAERIRLAEPRQQRERLERVQRQRREARSDNVLRLRERAAERQSRSLDRRVARVRDQQVRQQRQAARDARQSIERQFRDSRRAERVAQKQVRFDQRQAERIAKSQDRFDRRQARAAERVERAFAQRQFASSQVGQRFDPQQQQLSRDWYDGYAAQRYQAFTSAAPDYFYDYNPDNGYLYQVDRDRDVVVNLFPMLGGAFGVGQPLPIGYDYYNVPYAYRDLYYDTPDYYYRYGAGAIYRVDPTTQLIQGVVALLTGQQFGVGQMLPMGYDAYNVPYAYRSSYYDTPDSWYRYGDGYIYEVDPFTRRIVRVIPISYGNNYAVGYPVPAYASYGGYGGYAGYPSYAVPNAYQSLYYDAPGYNYHYANGGIYQVNPLTQLITAVVALVTGTNLGVGQMLPTGYDAYNVPYAYRSRYYDTRDAWYRYDDGAIYQVDPRTRIIQAAIPVSYGGYAVGYPVPAAYPGYPVPGAYQDLYYPVAGYDYRYFDHGIYQIDPRTQMVLGMPALVTGADLGIGQPLPIGYDAYNVPYAYRDRYFDTPDSWYRYADGYIYEVDPATRLVTEVIDAIA